MHLEEQQSPTPLPFGPIAQPEVRTGNELRYHRISLVGFENYNQP